MASSPSQRPSDSLGFPTPWTRGSRRASCFKASPHITWRCRRTRSSVEIAASYTRRPGGVGLLLCQIAKRRGAWIVGTTSTAEKAKLALDAGADEVILYTQQDFVSEVKRLTDGKGVHVVYDSVGKTTFDGSLDCLAKRGMMVLFGQSSGPVPPLDPQILNRKGSLFLTRPTIAHYVESRADLVARASELFRWVEEGWLNVRIGATFPLADASVAHAALEARKTVGKVLLIP